MNEDAIEFLVTSDEHNQRIDKVVTSKLSEYSRVVIKEWIESGNILLEKGRSVGDFNGFGDEKEL